MATPPARGPVDHSYVRTISSDVRNNWTALRSCTSEDAEMMFDHPKQHSAHLQPLCAGCPIAALCLTQMLSVNTDRNPLLYGYWAGVNAEPVTGKMTAYIRAIAKSAVHSPLGNEAAYLATRFLMEQTSEEVDESGGAITDEQFNAFVLSLKLANKRYIDEAIVMVLEGGDPAKALSTYPAKLVEAILLHADGPSAASPTAS